MKTAPVDIESALYEYLTDNGWSCSALPVPVDIDENLPFVVLQRTGGNLNDRVITHQSVSFDIYAKSWTEASDKCADLCADILALENETLDGEPVYAVEVESIGYNNASSDFPTLARMSQNFLITIRTKELKNG